MTIPTYEAVQQALTLINWIEYKQEIGCVDIVLHPNQINILIQLKNTIMEDLKNGKL